MMQWKKFQQTLFWMQENVAFHVMRFGLGGEIVEKNEGSLTFCFLNNFIPFIRDLCVEGQFDICIVVVGSFSLFVEYGKSYVILNESALEIYFTGLRYAAGFIYWSKWKPTRKLMSEHSTDSSTLSFFLFRIHDE